VAAFRRIERVRGAHVSLENPDAFRSVDLASHVLPARITGSLAGIGAKIDLAVAVNGTIAAVTQSYREFGETRFAAFVPERALRRGDNDVEVYAVRGRSATPSLAALGGSEFSLRLVTSGSRVRIVPSTGGTIDVRKGAVVGQVRAHARGGTIVFVGGKAVFQGDASNYRRRDVEQRLGVTGVGFLFRVPASLLPPREFRRRVRVFVIAGRTASELAYRAPGL
jgi:hypothetical protein